MKIERVVIKHRVSIHTNWIECSVKTEGIFFAGSNNAWTDLNMYLSPNTFQEDINVHCGFYSI